MTAPRRLSEKRMAVIRRHLTGDRIVARMIQEIDALTEALAEYGEHRAHCAKGEHPDLHCSCGFDVAVGRTT